MEPVLLSNRSSQTKANMCWVKTTLVGCRQRLIFKAQMAEWLQPPMGFPQIKGRFLFLIYANALPWSITKTEYFVSDMASQVLSEMPKPFATWDDWATVDDR